MIEEDKLEKLVIPRSRFQQGHLKKTFVTMRECCNMKFTNPLFQIPTTIRNNNSLKLNESLTDELDSYLEHLPLLLNEDKKSDVRSETYAYY